MMMITAAAVVPLRDVPITTVRFVYSPRGAEYCDEHVCVSVCLCVSVCEHISDTTGQNFTKFSAHVTYVGGSALL